MTDSSAVIESLHSLPPVGAEGYAGAETVRESRLRRAYRRACRALGLFIVISMTAFLMNQHVLRPFTAPG